MSNRILTTFLEEPRAVSIVLGHLGASNATLERYSQLYLNRNCSVIAAASPPLRFMLNQSLRPTAQEIVNHAVTALRDVSPKVPLVIHSFSNGGALLLEQIELILSEDDGSQEDLQLVSSRLQKGYQFFDSCPCYIRTIWDTSRLTASFPNPKMSSVGRTIYALSASSSLTLWCTFTLSWHRPQQFWQRMVNSQACNFQIYMYTTTDMASDANAVDQLVETRRSMGIDCTAYRYNDSNHCRLDKDHPEEYGKAIDDALAAAVQRANDSTQD